MVIEVFHTACTKRNQTLCALRRFLGDYISQTSVHMVLSVGSGAGCHYGTGYQECATALIYGFIGLNGTGFTLADRLEVYCALLTGIDAIKAIHTARIIYLMVLGVYA